MVLYSDDIPKVTFVHPYMMDMLDYNFNLDQADRQFDRRSWNTKELN